MSTDIITTAGIADAQIQLRRNLADGLLTVKQFAGAAQLAPGSVYRMIRAGRLPAVRIGGAVRVAASQLGRAR
jgi:excisionase family DNA binding protein